MDEDKQSDSREQEADQQPHKAGDWILELFGPSYATAAEALAQKDDSSEEVRKVRFLSAFDPESIKNVYERVHMMIKLNEDLKKEATDAQTDSTSALQASAENEKVNLRDSGIWNSEELSVLRNVFRTAKSQISELEVKLRQTQRHSVELEDKLVKQGKELEVKSAKLSEATKANHRLKIHCDDLQLQLNKTGMKLDAVTEMWKEIDQEKLRMMKETQEMRIALDKERLAREQLEIQLEEAGQEVTRERMLAEDNAKTRYEHRILKLEEELRKTQEELDSERQLHVKSKKALEHLRNHFASLPLQDVLPPSVVDRDQVSRISHID